MRAYHTVPLQCHGARGGQGGGGRAVTQQARSTTTSPPREGWIYYNTSVLQFLSCSLYCCCAMYRDQISGMRGFTARHQASKTATERLARAKAKGGETPTLCAATLSPSDVSQHRQDFSEKKKNLQEASKPKPLTLYHRLMLLCRFHQQEKKKRLVLSTSIALSATTALFQYTE